MTVSEEITTKLEMEVHILEEITEKVRDESEKQPISYVERVREMSLLCKEKVKVREIRCDIITDA